jgi:structural maintenance of chromosome 1
MRRNKFTYQFFKLSEGAGNVLKDKKKESGKISRELAKVEQDIREVETDMNKKHLFVHQVRGKSRSHQKEAGWCPKFLEQARKADKVHPSDIQKIEDELNVVMEKKWKFEDEIATGSQRRGSNIHLEQNFLKEYDSLKQADLKSAKFLSKLDRSITNRNPIKICSRKPSKSTSVEKRKPSSERRN